MDAQVLSKRVELLQAEAAKAKQNVASLTEQLEQAKAHFSVVSGHLNESAYIMNEFNQASIKTNQEVMDSLNHKDTEGMPPENEFIEPDKAQQ